MHLPLNGERLLRSAQSSLTARPAQVLRDALQPERPAPGDDAPDGTNAATKHRAVDPSQGYSSPPASRGSDPLLADLIRVLNRH